MLDKSRSNFTKEQVFKLLGLNQSENVMDLLVPFFVSPDGELGQLIARRETLLHQKQNMDDR